LSGKKWTPRSPRGLTVNLYRPVIPVRPSAAGWRRGEQVSVRINMDGSGKCYFRTRGSARCSVRVFTGTDLDLIADAEGNNRIYHRLNDES